MFIVLDKDTVDQWFDEGDLVCETLEETADVANKLNSEYCSEYYVLEVVMKIVPDSKGAKAKSKLNSVATVVAGEDSFNNFVQVTRAAAKKSRK